MATSIIFTSCFSTKKINVHATSAVAGLGAYTLYQICYYIGGLVITSLGVGYAYENRNEIAEFGKNIIDSISDLSTTDWILGSHTMDGDYVYGSEALQEVQDTEWTVIKGGGNSPKNDNDGDGDKDEDDLIHEFNLNAFFLTQAGLNLFENHIKPIYDSWVNKDENNFLESKYGIVDALGFSGTLQVDADGYYYGEYSYQYGNYHGMELTTIRSKSPIVAFYYPMNSTHYAVGLCTLNSSDFIEGKSVYFTPSYTDVLSVTYNTNFPVLTSLEAHRKFYDTGEITDVSNFAKFYRIADWLADEDAWRGILEDLALSLRSLQGLSNLAQEFSNYILQNRPTVNVAGDTLNEYATYNYAPVTNVFITQPTYYPATSTTPHFDISVFPNYDIYIQNGGCGEEIPPDDDIPQEDTEIDLNGLLSIFNILFYLIMIIVMLIYLFLSCLAFIVMIFRIPASSTMLPEEMVMGFDHLKTIMIPGMNISIYGFAMALIYMFIIFAVIKLIRLEINDFKFPRSYK